MDTLPPADASVDAAVPGECAVRAGDDGAALGVNVLVLDARADQRRRLCLLLRSVGAVPVDCSTAAQALQMAEQGRTDVVLCGVADGGTLLREVAAARSHDDDASPWELVAVLPDAADESLLESLEGLADDFIVSPVSLVRLTTRLRYYARLHAQLARMRVQQTLLKRYQDDVEEEQRIASHLISRLDSCDPVAEQVMHAWVAAAHHLSGDVVAVARAPDDRINVLLADGTGHGLAAAISVLPVSEVFHRMTERGFDVAAMVTEMNRKVRSFMPVDRFVACVVASIDMRERVVDLWNGGCPPVSMLGQDGSVAKVWRSRHMALGVLGPADFDASVERVTYEHPSQLMVVSDGLSEALSPSAGERFGDRGLKDAVRGPANMRLERVVRHLQEFTGNAPLEDDASIVLVDCLLEPLAEPVSTRPAAKPGPASHWVCELRLGAAQLRRLSLVPFISGTLDQIGVPLYARSNVYCVLSELLTNALDYSLLKLDPGLRHGDGGYERYRQERAARLEKLSAGSMWVRAALEPGAGERACLRLEIEDSGSGCDFEAINARIPRVGSATTHARSARGLELFRSLCEELRFDQDGRRVLAVISLTPPT
jgi:serine phosphatase RsbU (regulator of sigma subunit)/anti-sigma regulatory factor (Ser/Thr protein kinase)